MPRAGKSCSSLPCGPLPTVGPLQLESFGLSSAVASRFARHIRMAASKERNARCLAPVSPAGPLRLPASCTWTGTCTVALLAQLVQLAQHAQPVLGSGFGFGFGEKKRKGKEPGQMSGCVSQPWLVLGIRNNKLPCSSVGGQRLNSFQPLCPPPRLGPRPRPHRKARLGFAFNPSPSLQLSLARSQYACLPTSSLLLLLSLSLLSLPLSLRSVTAPPSRRRTLRLFSPPPSH